ncbi:MAG TPA: alkyl hydroperoxide reductase [Herpetosiphonaceae bacterium]|nr:alkyl hydroperoxide reductase [Herpetosiphonaceae bacterium]
MIPQLRSLEERFGPRLQVVGVHAGKYRAERRTPAIRAAVRRAGIAHPVANDRQLRTWRAYACNGWPTLVLLGPEGRHLGAHAGEIPAGRWAPLLERLIDHYGSRGALRDDQPEWRRQEDPEGGWLRFPAGVAFADGRLYVADTGHQRVIEARLSGDARRATVVRSFGSGRAGLADGPAAEAGFNHPCGLAAHANRLYVADTENHALRAIDLSSGAVSTLAGTGAQGYARLAGPALATALSSPADVLADEGGAIIAMAGFHQLWRYDHGAGTVGPVVGTGAENLVDGPVAAALLAQPEALAAGPGVIYAADAEGNAIREVRLGGEVRTLVGTGLFAFGDKDGVGDEAELQHPQGLAWSDGELYVADTYNHRIKRLDPATRRVASWLGAGSAGREDGAGLAARFWEPRGLAVAGRHLLIADTNNHAIRVADRASGEVWTLEW